MKYIKFVMSSGQPITVPEEKAIRILQSSQKIDLVTDENGKWTGEAINKAHIVSTQRDFQKERDEAEQQRIVQSIPSKEIEERIKLTRQKYEKTNMLRIVGGKE